MTDTINSRVTAGVLIGGRSRRMGTPKALLPHPHGGTFVEYAVKMTAAVATDVALLGDLPNLPAMLTNRRLADSHPGGGPLAGLCALLRDIGDGWGLLVACDLPLLEPALLRTLLEHATDANDAAAFRQTTGCAASPRGTLGDTTSPCGAAGDGPTYHACCSLFHTRALPAVERELFEGRGRVQTLFRAMNTATLTPTDEQCRQLTNVNTPDELEML